MRYRVLDTPTGPFALCVERDGTLRTTWIRRVDRESLLGNGRPDESLRPDLCRLIHQYFAGAAVDFSAVPTPKTTARGAARDPVRDTGEDPEGDSGPDAAPEFFRRCWAACRAIPRGETRTYGELAVLAGSTVGAARAAGGAMRNNPLPIIVPCHRVVAAGERLGGFSGSDDPEGWAVGVKRWLLDMEGAASFPLDQPLLFAGAMLETP